MWRLRRRLSAPLPGRAGSVCAANREAAEYTTDRRYTDHRRGCGGIGRRARFRSVCPSGRGGSSPLIRTLTRILLLTAAALAAVSLSGEVLAAKRIATTEVVVTLHGRPLGAAGTHS